MPSKNTVRDYKENGFYHIYNRGVAKQKIFLDQQDYKTFLSYLKTYLSSKDLQDPNLKIPPTRQLKNFCVKVILHCYCLMPNHFHLLLYQNDFSDISLFLKSLLTKYSMYFNKKYRRVGPVFEGKYKAVEVESEEQFLYLSKYIHRNPLPTGSDPVGLINYKYSSYLNYLGLINQTWVKTADILSYFKRTNPANSYKVFIEESDESDLIRIKNQVIDIND